MTQLDEHGVRILAFVEHYQRQHHRSPTYREIGAAVGLVSNDHVARDLRRLVQQGYLSFTPGVSRSIVLLKPPRIHQRPALPLPNFVTRSSDFPTADDELNRLAAGLFEEEKDTFILRARGNALREALLEEGDLVVVKRNAEHQDGDMLAVFLKKDKRTALKYLYRENGHLRLQAPNSAVPAEHVKPNEIEIRGMVLAILRKRDT